MEEVSQSLRKAVALRYRKSKDVAPRVTASGQGLIADAMIKRANDEGITLMEDPDLVNLLSKIPVGDTIPTNLYKAVSEVLAYVYNINKIIPK